MRWRAEPPIVDPIPVTRQRVAAFSLACLAVVAAVVPLWTASRDELPDLVASAWGGIAALTMLTTSRVAYRAVLASLDPAQVDPPGSRPRKRVDAVFDAAVCGLVALLGVWLGTSGAGWAWISAAICAGLAVAAARDVSRDGGGSWRSPRGQ